MVIFSFTLAITFSQSSGVYAKVIDFVDSSAEMKLSIPYNSTVVLDTNVTSFGGLEPEDVIAYYTPIPNDGKQIKIHRITGIVMGDMVYDVDAASCANIRGQNLSSYPGEDVLVTKGEDNGCSLPGIDYPITERDYIVKVVKIITTKNLHE